MGEELKPPVLDGAAGANPPEPGGAVVPGAAAGSLSEPAADPQADLDADLPEDPEALKQELRNLRSVIGKQGFELGELRPLKDELTSVKDRAAQLEAYLAQVAQSQPAVAAGQPQQPPPTDPYEDLDRRWYQTRFAEVSEDIEERLISNGDDPDDARAKAQERAQRRVYGEYEIRKAERELLLTERRKEREAEERRRDLRAGVDDYGVIAQRHILLRKLPFSREDAAEALRSAGMPLSQLEAMGDAEQGILVETLGYAALGRKALGQPAGSQSTRQPAPTLGAGPTGSTTAQPVRRTPTPEALAARAAGEAFGFTGEALERYVQGVLVKKGLA